MTPRKRMAWVSIVAIAVICMIVAIVSAVAVSIRVETGEWRVPDGDDFVRIARRLDRGPSRTIYLERRPVDLRPGDDDAPTGTSSIVMNGIGKPVRTKGFTGGDARWKSLLSCVQKQFAPFDVEVTDTRPSHNDFILVAVGGVPKDIGIKQQRVSGLAPFNGGVIPRAVVFAFSAQVGNDPRTICETIAMEVGHAYGLDHEYLCKDVMTYLSGCGAKTFVDADAPCGEGKKRACEGGAKTQNSYRRLIDALGARAR